MNTITRCVLSALLTTGLFVSSSSASPWMEGMQTGKAEFKTMGPLAFGPEGILFVADSKSAAITAIATGDTAPARGDGTVKIEKINQQIAALLGTTADRILIDDMVVNPLSRNVYLAVSRGRGPEATPVLIRANRDGRLETVSLDNVNFSRAQLPDAPVDGVIGEGRRQSNPRLESITDIALVHDKLVIAGLSNEEFASTLRTAVFPFRTVPDGTTVEIYHGAHGQFETRSPVRTFVPINVGDEPSLLAAYICTPLVQFPIKDLTPGAKIRGKTLAELGNRNRPLDMVVYQKDGKDYLLLANSSRGVMKISTDELTKVEGILERVEGGGTKGLPYETVANWTGVDQLDLLDPRHALVMRRDEAGSLNLESLPLP